MLKPPEVFCTINKVVRRPGCWPSASHIQIMMSQSPVISCQTLCGNTGRFMFRHASLLTSKIDGSFDLAIFDRNRSNDNDNVIL